MTWEPQQVFNDQLDWLVTMARNPASKAHSWARAQELSKESSGLFTGIDQALLQRMRSGQASVSESADQQPTRLL